MSSLCFIALMAAAGAAAQACTLQFDGLKFSELLQFPSVTPSLTPTNPPPPLPPPAQFDGPTHKPLEVTISDSSIFNNQTGFRRAELLPASNNGSDPSTSGIKTVHFSIQKDSARPLNTSHEYQMFFLESADFSTNQVVLKTGMILGGSAEVLQRPGDLFVFGNVNSEPGDVLFQTEFVEGVWHNFGIVLDFGKNTTQVLYSTCSAPLKAVTSALPNDVSGQGQFHFGLLKKTVDGGADITKSGIQEEGIDEGVIYRGIFEEDSEDGCVSLKL